MEKKGACMKLRHKSQMLIIVSTVALAVLFSLIALPLSRSNSLNVLTEQGRMAADMILLSVSHATGESNPHHRMAHIKGLAGIPDLKQAHVIASKTVVKQMGIDTTGRDPVTAEEMQVISTGTAYENMTYSINGVRFHNTIPYIASARGVTNCLGCHDAGEGDVLGAVSLEIDATGQFYTAITYIAGAVLLFGLFGLIITLILRHLLKPVELTTAELKQVVALAEGGNFSNRITKYSDDEIGDIAERTNHFLDTLENSIGSIASDVDTLLSHHKFTEADNLLNTTVSVVNTMAMVSRFKQVIENDRTLEDVYLRFQILLEEQFKFKRYSFYEAAGLNRALNLIFKGGVPQEDSLWCNREITSNCDFCRASRTAHLCSSVGELSICHSFAGNSFDQQERLYHICLPIMLSGSVGGILQLVFSAEERSMVESDLPVLEAFMHEAAPVIESKRLMKSLKESSMRDPLTNLYNRRFLEEYVGTLTSGISRRKSQIGVVMCDIDHFKHVNDTYGHEVGDDVLKGACEIMMQTVRGSDIVVRLGGEEFLVLLIDSSEEGALMVSERIRAQLEEHQFKTAQGAINKTMSLGVTLFPSDSDDFWECVKRSDVALYQAKRTGRNQVIRYVEGMQSDD
ncbi:MAG: hypothetical protein AUJ57_05110 [Zetaproteobacteria bacterium CG1_02_53_45]|nr:MAG: hypothetical protein AUJ57_05110 [Zetaproteobacteria bacterium CG1_02_53_45]